MDEVLVRLDLLSVEYSPRQVPVDWEHVDALREVLDDLPAIVVDRRTMAVVDGIHRLEALRSSGRSAGKVRLFDGDEFETLALAVSANTSHGKPLSRAERSEAAQLLLACSPESSDRRIGQICGLSHSTVARLRQAAGMTPPATRVGRDGRRRPLHPEAARTKVEDAIVGDGDLSIREAARVAGVAPSTAQRVAKKLRSPRLTSGINSPKGAAPTLTPTLHKLSTSDGFGVSAELAFVNEWLDRTALSAADVRSCLSMTPLVRVYEVADECRRRALAWADLASGLEDRARLSSRPEPVGNAEPPSPGLIDLRELPEQAVVSSGDTQVSARL